MDLRLNDAVMNVELSGIRRFTFLVRDTPGACALTIGEPDLNTPDPIKEAAKAALDANDTHYPPGNGFPYLLEAISKFEAERHGLHYGPDEILVTVGATEALSATFNTLLNPGDEVIIPTPAFGLYEALVRLRDGVPVFLPTEDSRFQIVPEALAGAITPRTKAIVLTSPNNPTGCVWNRKQMENVMQLAIEHDFYIVSDEIYEKLLYTGEKPCSIASLSEEAKAHTLVVNGVSKSYAMTGFRIGYTAGPRDVIKAMTNYQSQSTSAPNSAAQHAAAAALCGDQSCVETMRQAFQQRRDRIVERINAIPGLSCNKPDGAFYVMMDVRPLLGKRLDGQVIATSSDFANALLEKQHAVIVPGESFLADGFCRLSYATSMEAIEDGMNRLANFVKELN
ncbi:MAG: pyridoxal phosphate-dependent aminotransferase [Clostridiales bacterium]|nr:pyridoxal phosphate-dependent aminotransferase [Clostridiales bacterium]